MLKACFDSNVIERIVCPEGYPNDSDAHYIKEIRSSIQHLEILPCFSETGLIIEALPKGARGIKWIELMNSSIDVSRSVGPSGEITLQIQIGGTSDLHPGAKPIYRDRLKKAVGLGFRVLPVNVLGLMRPASLDLSANYIEKEYWPSQDLDQILTFEQSIYEAIESKGVGPAHLVRIAKRIQQRLGLVNPAWFDGLDRPLDAHERAEIDRAFAEWSDAHSISLSISYGMDVFCTEDYGKASRNSVLDPIQRLWLSDTYGIQFMNIREFSEHLSRR